MNNNIEINIIDNYADNKYLATIDELRTWIKLCLCRKYNNITISLMLVNLLEGQKFNINFRGKNGPTNILSFPYKNDKNLIGDLVICAPLVISEAEELKKPESSHWRHLFVHGMLHLQGYDHQNDDDEKTMVSLEDKIIATIINLEQGNKA